MAAPQVLDLPTILAQLDPAYQGSMNLVNEQIGAIPGMVQAQQTGLDTAKANSFIDINNNANSKGMAFSGMPIGEQTRYMGEKYMPALANLQTAATNQKTSLQQQLAQLQQDRYKTALSTQQGQQKSLQDYNSQQEQNAFTANQNALQRQAQAALAASSNAPASQAGVQYVKNKNGGFDLINATGEKNNTLDLAGYVKMNGGSISNLLSIMSEGDAQDKRAVQNYYNNIQKGMPTTQAYAQLKKDRPTAFYKGGNV